MTTAVMEVISLPAPVPINPPIESIALAICSAVLRCRALIQERRDERRHAGLSRGILRRRRPERSAAG